MFVVNAVSFLVVVGAVAAWQRPPRSTTLPPEHLASAIRTGARYVANAPEFRVILLRAAAYVLTFSALPALLAVFTRVRLHSTAAGYGALLAALGVGGVLGAVLLARVRARWPTDRIIVTGTLIYGAGLAGLASPKSVHAASGLLVRAGLAGMANMSSLNIASQSMLPDWVRGRGLALFQLTSSLSFAVGGISRSESEPTATATCPEARAGCPPACSVSL